MQKGAYFTENIMSGRLDIFQVLFLQKEQQREEKREKRTSNIWPIFTETSIVNTEFIV